MFLKLAAAISIAAIAAPAAATKTPAGNEAAAKSSAAPAPAAQEKRYCMQYDTITGSRTRARTECRTKADWARRGVDIGTAG